MEFAICAVLFIGLIYGSISFGVVFWVKHTLTSAASEGARAAVGAPVGHEVEYAKAKAKAVVDSSLGDRGAHVPLEAITATIATCAGSTHQCITVRVPYPYSAHPILPALPPILSVLPGTLASTSVIELSS
ncbi:MAG: TadE/TadG family type IV pilus assembly protein [Acidimicrobiales bacterium]